MKLIVKNPKPRNPLVAPSLHRKSGRHGATAGGERQRAVAALRRELERLVKPSP